MTKLILSWSLWAYGIPASIVSNGRAIHLPKPGDPPLFQTNNRVAIDILIGAGLAQLVGSSAFITEPVRDVDNVV